MKRYMMVGLLGFIVMAMGWTPAYAIPTLSLTANGVTVTVSDGDGLDANPFAGAVTYVGGVGSNWNLNVSTGLVLGPTQLPTLDLNSVNVSSTGTGTLEIKFSASGLGPALDSTAFVAGIGGTVGLLGSGSISFQTFLNNALLTSIGPISGSGSPFASSAVSDLRIPGEPYTLTEVVTLTHSGNSVTSSFDASVAPVPEPATLLLLGSGLAALGIGIRKRTGKK